MQIRLIRNATLRIRYGGLNFLADPMLLAKGELESFAGIAPNPTVDLPSPVEEILDGVEAVLVSHLHPDHYDMAARNLIAKDTPIYCQPGDEAALQKDGFRSVYAVAEKATIGETTLLRTTGRHGTGKWETRMDSVSGFVLKNPNEPTIYWAGDTIWCEAVRAVLDRIRPDIVLTHSCGAKLKNSEPIIMDHEQTIALCKAAPYARVIAIHMEALDHATVTRDALRHFADKQGITDQQLLIPKDGETFEI